jgi:hypothetical protein
MSLNTTVNRSIGGYLLKKTLRQQLSRYRLCREKLHFSGICRNKIDLQDCKSDGKVQQLVSSKDDRSKFRSKLLKGPNLKDFFKAENLRDQENIPEEEVVPYLQDATRLCDSCRIRLSLTELLQIWTETQSLF